MNVGLVIMVILLMLLLAVTVLSVKAYSDVHKKLEVEREESDKYERLFKFMGKWMEAEEKGFSISNIFREYDKEVIIFGDNPVANVLKSKLDRTGIIYRAETEPEDCTNARLVVVTDISHYEKWHKKLEKLGLETVSLEDIFYNNYN